MFHRISVSLWIIYIMSALPRYTSALMSFYFNNRFSCNYNMTFAPRDRCLIFRMPPDNNPTLSILFSVQYFDWCLCWSLPSIVPSRSVPNQGSGGVTVWQCDNVVLQGGVARGEGGWSPRHWTHHNTVSSELVTPNNNNNRTRLNTREREREREKKNT